MACVTGFDVARLEGVSQPAVSRVLRDLRGAIPNDVDAPNPAPLVDGVIPTAVHRESELVNRETNANGQGAQQAAQFLASPGHARIGRPTETRTSRLRRAAFIIEPRRDLPGPGRSVRRPPGEDGGKA